jgi:prepilin-type N-terminal cleavage/methylation domain-containing protein
MSTSRRRACSGFSFVEILVVMGIIAVLVGMGVGVYMLATRKAPEVRTDALLAKMRANVDALRGKLKTYPPSDLNRLPVITGVALKIGKPTPQNVSNWGIESLYQGLRMPGFDHNPDLADGDLCNTDEDALDRPLQPSGDAALYEVQDGWGNPLVYFVESEYATAEKDPPVYLTKGGEASVYPKPYRSASGAGFAQPNAYQIYSMGPDGLPNTEDDRLGWEAR